MVTVAKESVEVVGNIVALKSLENNGTLHDEPLPDYTGNTAF
jgi:hypothetical protein